MFGHSLEAALGGIPGPPPPLVDDWAGGKELPAGVYSDAWQAWKADPTVLKAVTRAWSLLTDELGDPSAVKPSAVPSSSFELLIARWARIMFPDLKEAACFALARNEVLHRSIGALRFGELVTALFDVLSDWVEIASAEALAEMIHELLDRSCVSGGIQVMIRADQSKKDDVSIPLNAFSCRLALNTMVDEEGTFGEVDMRFINACEPGCMVLTMEEYVYNGEAKLASIGDVLPVGAGVGRIWDYVTPDYDGKKASAQEPTKLLPMPTDCESVLDCLQKFCREARFPMTNRILVTKRDGDTMTLGDGKAFKGLRDLLAMIHFEENDMRHCAVRFTHRFVTSLELVREKLCELAPTVGVDLRAASLHGSCLLPAPQIAASPPHLPSFGDVLTGKALVGSDGLATVVDPDEELLSWSFSGLAEACLYKERPRLKPVVPTPAALPPPERPYLADPFLHSESDVLELASLPLQNIIVLGPPQPSKRPAAYALARKSGLQYISLDHAVQVILATPDEKKSPIMGRIWKTLLTGGTITLSLLLRVVREFCASALARTRGYVLDLDVWSEDDIAEVVAFVEDLRAQAAIPTVIWEEFIKDPDPLPVPVELDDDGNPKEPEPVVPTETRVPNPLIGRPRRRLSFYPRPRPRRRL
jgi:hypothetical protein